MSEPAGMEEEPVSFENAYSESVQPVPFHPLPNIENPPIMDSMQRLSLGTATQTPSPSSPSTAAGMDAPNSSRHISPSAISSSSRVLPRHASTLPRPYGHRTQRIPLRNCPCHHCQATVNHNLLSPPPHDGRHLSAKHLRRPSQELIRWPQGLLAHPPLKRHGQRHL